MIVDTSLARCLRRHIEFNFYFEQAQLHILPYSCHSNLTSYDDKTHLQKNQAAIITFGYILE